MRRRKRVCGGEKVRQKAKKKIHDGTWPESAEPLIIWTVKFLCCSSIVVADKVMSKFWKVSNTKHTQT